MALKKELINDEVIDIAIDFHGILANLTESCPPDCLVDLFTELISLLNKYDKSLKVKKDLVDELRELSKNDMVLTGKLEQEKQADFEESLVYEEKAVQEIRVIKQDNKRT